MLTKTSSKRPSSGASPGDDVQQRPPGRPYRRRALTVIIVIAVLLLAWWLAGQVLAYTDDAYLDSDVVSVTPEVAGPIDSVVVRDNQFVSKGKLLFTIDPTPFDLELKQASAREAQARAQLSAGHREQALTQAQSPEAGNQPLEAQLALLESTRALAEWRRSRTRIVAPLDGFITHLTLHPGDMAQPGHPALAIVDARGWHIVANYKEYYLHHLKPGQLAWVWLDTHPWQLYRARIEGIAHGISRSDAAERLVPYVSPTVDWIKIQRRVPVRLTLVDPPPAGELFAGTDAGVLVFY